MKKSLPLFLLTISSFFILKSYSQTCAIGSSFGENGKVFTNFSDGNSSSGNDIIQLSDGNILVAGSNGIAKISNTDGSFINSFGNAGKISIALVYKIKEQPDGKIVGITRNATIFRINANGALDIGFGTNGFVATTLSGNDIALQADGKIIVAGTKYVSNNDYAVARYNSDGSIDNSFDGDGIAISPIGTSDDDAYSVAIQSDGKIVVGGYSATSPLPVFAVVRYNTDGSLDNGFDGDGKATAAFSSPYFVVGLSDIVIQADGKIVQAGAVNLNSGLTGFALARYNSDGSLDNSFDGDGELITTIGVSDEAHSIFVQPDGKLMVAGTTSASVYSDANFALVRYNADGSLDNSFDGDGKLASPIGILHDYAYAVFVQSDGKIFATGNANNGSNSHFAVAKYNTNGSFDNTFNGTGKLIFDVGGSQDIANASALQADCKIVVAGYSNYGSNNGFAVARYNADGSLDNSFDGDGKLTTAILSGNDIATAVAIQTDGKIVVAGYSYNGSNYDFALARYNIDGSLDNSFDGDGKLTTAIGASHDVANSIAIQTDGKIVVAGSSNGAFALVRYNSNGTLDNTFNGTGKVTTTIGVYDIVYSIVIQSDGKIVVAGSSNNGHYSTDFALARYNTDGTLDNSFDGDGKLTTTFTLNDIAHSVALQTDGKIIAAGEDITGLVIARYNTDGSLDNSFDGDGKVTSSIPIFQFAATPTRVQADGKIIVASGDRSDIFLARFNTDGSSDNTFGNTGLQTFNLGGQDYATSLLLANNGYYIGGYSNRNDANDFIMMAVETNNITVSPYTIPTLLCQTSGFGITYTATGTYNSGNIFTAQLSDASGSFSNPVTIGTIASTSSGTIQCDFNNPPPGTHYRIRVVASNPLTTGSDNGTDLEIKQNITYYRDADGDGFGDANISIQHCAQLAGWVTNSSDCNDNDAAIHQQFSFYPDTDGDGFGTGAAVMVCAADANTPPSGYSINNTDCNDADAEIHAPFTYYRDADGDGFGDPNNSTTVCQLGPPSGYVFDNTDCNDNNSAVHTQVTPTITISANSLTICSGDNITLNAIATYAGASPYFQWYKNGNLFGGGSSSSEEFANTQNGDVYTAKLTSSEACADPKTVTGNSLIITVTAQTIYYRDADNDGYGNLGVSVSSCTQPVGYVADNTDCDDNDATIHQKYPFYADNDGDGYAGISYMVCAVNANTPPPGYSLNYTDCNDNDPTIHSPRNYYRDFDGDGFGNPNNSMTLCLSTTPSGFVTDNTDCNDNDASVHSPQTYYRDTDGDGFGDANVTTTVCSSTAPTGYVTNSSDCDDTKLLYADNDNDGYGTGSPVACGVADNTDCNDNDASVHTGITYYRDADGDGFGDAGNTTTVCSSTAPTGYVTNSSDCDDTKLLYADNDGDGYGAGSPVACGIANNTDCNDADVTVHTGITYYRDADGDGFGDANVTTTVCSSTAPSGYVTNSSDCDDTKLLYADNDNDGYGSGSPVACGVADNTDCNDADASVHTGITYYRDADGDGFGDANVTTTVCSSTAPSGYVTNSSDCDDTKLLYADNDNDGYGSGSPVACGVADNTDCNDADASVHTGITYYRDADGDGFGDANVTTTVCSSTAPEGYVTNSSDCDDTKKLYADNDGDGYGAGSPVACGVANNTDCNDADATVHTGITYYRDADGDGFGDANVTTTVCSSTAPTGYVSNSTDCDDTKLLYADNDHDGFGAGAPVACGVANNTDCNDADASVHTGITYYRDADGDGFGDPNVTTTVCSSTAPTGYVTNSSDCDDTKLLYADNDNDGYGAGSPVACGVANNTDCNDNDASVHTGITYYRDADGDGFGDANVTTTVCSSTALTGYVTNSSDCDDTKKLYADNDGDGYGAGSPVACGVANNTDCNDNDASVHTGITYYRDADGDGFGDPNVTTTVCSSTPPTGYVTNSSDCDDTKLLYADNDNDGYGAGSPVACGVANNTDCNDNDASVHTGITYYRDADGDGFGDANVTTTVCSSTAPTGYVTNSSDCDDTKKLYADNDGDGYGAGSPVACGVADNTDCNDADASVHTGITYYRDADGDGFGDPNVTTTVCSSTAPTGYVTNSSDCDDTKKLYADNDGDGYGAGSPVACGVADNTDCNDADASVHTGITYYRDADGDGFGDPNVTTTVCSSTAPTGYVTNSSDCDDTKKLYADNDNDGFGAGAPVACGVANNTDCNDADATVHTGITYYRDADGDGFGDANVTTTVCSSTAPSGYVTNNTDCKDNDAAINPATIWYKDLDNDGYSDGATQTQCTRPLGYKLSTELTQTSGDCDDNNANVHPGATEICGNGIDDNCNGQIDEGCTASAPQISISDNEIKEGNKGYTLMLIKLTLDKASNKVVTAKYKTHNGTAKAGSDYLAQSGTIVFLPGMKTSIVLIAIKGDKTTEADETFEVVLSNAVNATIAKGTGVETILNDDGSGVASKISNRQEMIVEETAITLMPNPAQNKVNVKLSGYSGNVMIQLSDMNGRKLQEFKTFVSAKSAAQQQIDVSRYADGIYFISVIDEKGNRKTEKLIISK